MSLSLFMRVVFLFSIVMSYPKSVVLLFNGCMNETGYNRSDPKVVSCVDFILQHLPESISSVDVIDPRVAPTADLSNLDVLGYFFKNYDFFFLLLSK